jgi:hypothetical protein
MVLFFVTLNIYSAYFTAKYRYIILTRLLLPVSTNLRIFAPRKNRDGPIAQLDRATDF